MHIASCFTENDVKGSITASSRCRMLCRKIAVEQTVLVVLSLKMHYVRNASSFEPSCVDINVQHQNIDIFLPLCRFKSTLLKNKGISVLYVALGT